MPAFTPNLNLYKPGGGSTGLILPDEVADIDRLNANFDTIDSAVKADRDRLDGLEKREGLARIVPSAVTGHASVTVDADGLITFNNTPASATINILDIFSVAYRDYQIVSHFPVKPSAQAPAIQGLVGSTAIGATTYSRSIQAYIAGARQDSQNINQNSFGEMFFGYWGTLSAGVTDLIGPNLASPTFTLSQVGYLGGTTGISNQSSNLNSNDQLTGLRIALSAAGPWTGTLKIYGVR